VIKYFHNNKTLSFVLVSTLAFILYITLILSRVSGCFTLEVGSNSLGLSFYYTKDMVQNFFELRTEEQLLCYSDFLKIWDTIFAVVYTFMYASWIAFLLKNKRIFLIIPIFAMICDWVENYIEILMLEIYLKSKLIPDTFVSLGSGINSFKWIFSTLTYLLILLGIIIILIKFIKKPKLLN
jgi:hypothetical protein